MSAMAELSEFVSGAAERIGPSVVGFGRGSGRGSGVVIGEGEVLTNAHNLPQGEVTVVFADGERSAGEVAGADPDLDLAVVRVETRGTTPVEWAPEAPEPAIGSPVVALANPGGRGLRATLGFVSSERRVLRGPRGRRMEGGIEHTAALPRGSSGGPLVDEAGRLLGLNTLRLDGGLILAVRATAGVRRRVGLLAGGEAGGPRRLGVAVAPPRASRRMRRAVGLPERDGLLVRAVEADSAAERAGLERGDLIVSAAGEELVSVDALYEALDALPPEGGRVELGVVRGDDERAVGVELGGR